MKQEKICISKSIMIFAVVAVFLLGFVVFTNYLNGQKIGQKPKADEPNPVHVPSDKQKITCPVVGEPKAWQQTDNLPTYYANTGVCAGSDDPAKVYDGTGDYQVCCNEPVSKAYYSIINKIPLTIECPKDRPVEYSYGPNSDGPTSNCYRINGKVLQEGTANQTCGNLEMPSTTCCSNDASDYCQMVSSVAPTAAPTDVPTVAPRSSAGVGSLTCPPTAPYVYKYLVGTPGTNFLQSGCYLVEGMEVVDASGKSACSYKKMVGALKTACCGSASLPGCQPSPTPVPRYERD